MAEVLPFPVDDPEIARTVNEELRLQYRYLDLRRPEMARNLRLRSQVAAATRRVYGRAGLHRGGDAHPFQIHAGRGARISGAQPARAGHVLRPAAIAAAIQTNAHGGRGGKVLPNRPLLPRRGPAGRPATGIHPTGPGDELHRAGGHLRADRRAAAAHLETGAEHRGADALPAPDLPGGAQPLWHRQAGHPVRHGTGGFHGGISGQQVQGLQRRHCRRRRGQGPQRQGPGRRHPGPDRNHDRVRQKLRRARAWPTSRWKRANGNRPSSSFSTRRKKRR